MLVHHHVDMLADKVSKGFAATIGNFDGVHLGHQHLIHAVRSAASTYDLESLVILFEPHPKEWFSPHPPPRVMRLEDKIIALKRYGVDHVLVLNFNDTFKALSAQAFLDTILMRIGVKALIVGEDFHFGRDRQGDVTWLSEHADLKLIVTHDIALHKMAPRISSTLLRSFLKQRDIEAYKKHAGHSYRLSGCITKGQQLARQLGFPTLNIELGDTTMALQGIFAVTVYGLWEDAQPRYGVADLGVRPGLGKNLKPVLEVHVFDMPASWSVYGKQAEIQFEHYIREEAPFSSLEELQAWIAEDAEKARCYFSACLESSA